MSSQLIFYIYILNCGILGWMIGASLGSMGLSFWQGMLIIILSGFTNINIIWFAFYGESHEEE